MFQDADLVSDIVDITFSALNQNDATPSGPDAKSSKEKRQKRRDENFWRKRLIDRYMKRGARDYQGLNLTKKLFNDGKGEQQKLRDRIKKNRNKVFDEMKKSKDWKQSMVRQNQLTQQIETDVKQLDIVQSRVCEQVFNALNKTETVNT